MKQSLQYRNNTGEVTYNEESRSFSGYGIVFNSDSQPLYVYDQERGVVRVTEQISRDSLSEADMSDVISAINHNFERVLARTTSGTLQLDTDERGVMYRLELPDTTYANDLRVSVERGDITGSSFVFSMDMEEGYNITERSDGSLLAVPKRITKVYEMGPVTNPAYPETTAENRSGFLEAQAKAFLQRQEETKEQEQEAAPAEGTPNRDKIRATLQKHKLRG